MSESTEHGIIPVMNLLLLLDEYREGPNRWRVPGARALHVRNVLGLAVGDTLRAGIPDGARGEARVESIDTENVLVSFIPNADPLPQLPLQLVLALPRPKMLKRILIDAASLGVSRIVLLNSWKVDKSYWRTPNLKQELLREKLILGLEQAGTTNFPELFTRQRFRPFVEDELDALAEGTQRILAQPGPFPVMPTDLTEPVTLAVGPEGGWTPYEVDMLCQRGFRCHSFGQRILRVETAIPALVGRLMRLP